MSFAHTLAAQLLRRTLEPEAAHRAAIRAVRAGLGPQARADAFPNLATTIAGMKLANPVGLAAGFDKDCEAAAGMLAAGFGFVECGTVTPLPQSGNPRPRLFRLPADGAVINRLGFNNGGLDGFCTRLSARKPGPGVIGANVGANKDSADRIGDYCLALTRVWPFADYVTINISSPNTPGLRGLQEKGALSELLERTAQARAAVSRDYGARPLFLKVSPDIDDVEVADIAELALAWRLDALVVSNTTITRPATLRSAARGETGGLSGRPLLQASTEVLREFAQALKGRLALIGVGGVCSGASALMKIKAGASAVQLYTALVYEGPGLAARLARDLSLRLRAEGFKAVADAVGADL
jgi:dihydroorotate dehydrogenase